MDTRRYIAWLVESTPAAVRETVSDGQLLRSLQQMFGHDLNSRRDGEWARAYREHCPVPGADIDDYTLREIELGHDVSLLAGIHFLGGDVSQPFVGVYAQTRNLHVHAMKEASAILCDHFDVFKTRRVWWWVTGDRRDFEHHGTADQRLLVGTVGAVVATGQKLREHSAARDDIFMRDDAVGDTYEAYGEIFAQFLDAYPRWRGKIQRTEPDDYRRCAAEGALCVVEHEGQVAGVVAARRSKIRGIPGWEIVEEILATKLRGRGLAPLMQTEFVGRLPAASDELVIGTIDAENHPSLRTALRSGRVDAGGWWFIHPAAPTTETTP